MSCTIPLRRFFYCLNSSSVTHTDLSKTMKSIPETVLQTELSAKKSGKKARLTVDKVACEYSRYSLLLTARNVSPVGTSAP